MGYKTFEDMKHNIPEGATHYHNESDGYLFCWFKIEGGKWFVHCPDEGERWHKCNREHHRIGIVQFLQTESPEEREALDMIGATSKQVESLENDSELPNGSEWNGEGLPPVGVECEWKGKRGGCWVPCVVVANNGKDLVVQNSGDYKRSEFEIIDMNYQEIRKLETPQQREERERLEAAYDLYCDWCFANDYPKFSFDRFKSSKDLDGMLVIVDKTGYRKAAHLKEGE